MGGWLRSLQLKIGIALSPGEVVHYTEYQSLALSISKNA